MDRHYLDFSFSLHKIDYKTGKDLWITPLNLNGSKAFFVDGNYQEKDKIFFYINEQNNRKCYVIDCKTGELTIENKQNLQANGFLIPPVYNKTIHVNNSIFELNVVEHGTAILRKIK